MIPIDIERLRELYASATIRSLRLETRQAYGVPWEDGRMEAWLRGDPEPPAPWLDKHREQVRQRALMGRQSVRVRFVELPMTAYTARQFGWTYPASVEAGEEICIIDRADHPEFDHLREDFVVFDDTAVMYYRYADDDRLTGYEYTADPVMVREHLTLAEEVLAAATPFVVWNSVDR